MYCPQPPKIRIFLNGQQFHERTAAAPKPSASWFPAARLMDAQQVYTILLVHQQLQQHTDGRETCGCCFSFLILHRCALFFNVWRPHGGGKIVIDYTQIGNFYSRKILAAAVLFRALWHRALPHGPCWRGLFVLTRLLPMGLELP
jgi:hypothetical protein